MTKVTTLRHTKGKVPSKSSPSLVNKTPPQNNIANFVFLHLLLCPNGGWQYLLCIFPPYFWARYSQLGEHFFRLVVENISHRALEEGTCPTFLSLAFTCLHLLFSPTLGGLCITLAAQAAELILQCQMCQGSGLSRYKYALNTTDCFTAILGLWDFKANPSMSEAKSTKYIESCFEDLPKSPRMVKGERLCFHATCTSRL